MEHIRSLSLLARIFPRILVSVVNNEIGRYDDTLLGSRPGFGISEIVALYEVGGKPEVSFVWLSIRKSKGDSLGPNLLKNSTLKPFGPGALLLGKEEVTCVISSNVISLSNISAESNDNLGRFKFSKKVSKSLRI